MTRFNDRGGPTVLVHILLHVRPRLLEDVEMLIDQKGFSDLFMVMDRIPEMRGAGVVYLDDKATTMVRNSAHITGLSTWLVLEETDLEPVSPPKPVKPTNAQMLNSELLAMGLNCGAAVLLGIASAGSTVCTVGTGGTCTPLLVLTAVGAAATAAQCGISVGRVIEATLMNPDETGLANLDADPWYQGANVALEVASIVATIETGRGLYGRMKDIRTAEEAGQFFHPELVAKKAALGGELGQLLRLTGKDVVNGTIIRWVRGGRLSAIFTDATRSLTVTKLQLFADTMSAILSTVSTVKTDSVVPFVRGLRMHLIQQ
jgi:hypothetical protein